MFVKVRCNQECCGWEGEIEIENQSVELNLSDLNKVRNSEELVNLKLNELYNKKFEFNCKNCGHINELAYGELILVKNQ